jgi:heme exporter protein D
MTHLAYIASAYAISAAVLIGMAAWVLLDLSAQRRKLEKLEADGVRRRSEVRR